MTFVNHRCTGGFTYFALHFIHATFCIEPRNLIQNLTGGKDNADYQSWRQAFDEAVIYRKTTPKNYSGITYSMFSMEKAEGLSTYIPRGSFDSKINNFYRTLQWYSAAGWDETGW